MTPRNRSRADSPTGNADGGSEAGKSADRSADGAAIERRDHGDDHDRAQTDDAGPVTLTRKPTRFSSGCALAGALVAAAMTLLTPGADPAAAGFAGLGVLTIGIGLVRAQARAVDVGALALFAALVAGGVQSPAVEPLIVGTVATVLAWDLGHGGIDLGAQLGREARTIRLEVVHVGSSLLVGLLAGTVGYGVYVFGAGGQPAAAVVLLLLAAAFITVGLGAKRDGGTGRRRTRRGPPR